MPVYKRNMRVEVVPLGCEQDPHVLCKELRCAGVMASGNNYEMLGKFLEKRGIRSAYVFGWDGVYGLFVLHDTGAVVPYFEFNKDSLSNHILCMAECPCPPVYGQEKAVCPPQPCKEEYVNPCPQPCPPQEECFVVYEEDGRCKEVCVKPCPPYPCKESSSSEECREECRLYPGKSKKKCTSKDKCHRRCPIKVIEELTKLKRFTFDFSKYKRRGDVVVKVCSKEAKSKFERFTISKKGEIYTGNNKRCVPSCLPKCLRNPKKLLKLKKYIERKYCKKVCLYINEKCGIFVLVDGKFFSVSQKGKRPHLRRVRGHKLRKLIHSGLYGVEFGSISCN